MIIKKFQIPCPLHEDESLNETVSKVLNTTLSQLNNTAVDYSEDACTPKYFVFNSQVHICERSLFPEALNIDRTKTESQDGRGFKRADLFPQTVYAVPILTFAFVCHPAILPMYEELKE